MTDLVEAGCRSLDGRVSRPDDAGEPPAIVRPHADSDTATDTEATDSNATDADETTTAVTNERLAGLFDAEAVAIEPIREADPTVVLSRLWNDRNHDRAALFVAPDAAVADGIESLLTSPVGVRAADADGRTFHNGPDRVPLAEGGYAAVPAGTTLRWHETTAAPDRTGVVTTDDTSDTATGDTLDTEPDDELGDPPWLALHADNEPLVRLSGVDALACPPRDRFPYNYERDRDKQIRVRDFAGRPVARYTGIGAMRDAGFQPVPAPLVPEHMFDGSVAGTWAVVVGEE